MDIFDKVKDKITETSQTVVQKTRETTETMRLNNAVKAYEKELESQLLRIGTKFYAEQKDNCPSQYSELFEKATKIQNLIDENRAQIELLSNTAICNNCGKKVDGESKFCIYCGSKLDRKEEAEEAVSDAVNDEIQKCGNCGAPLEKDAVFCTECGTKCQ